MSSEMVLRADRATPVGRTRAVLIHFLATLVVASVAALLVFGVWYPYPYRSISGGLELFLLVVAVDVTIGPLLTAVVFNPAKGWRHLRRDLLVVGLLQVGCLAYGMHTVFVARPVYMVHEVDRFRVVSAADLDLEDLALADKPYQTLPMLGPQLVGTRRSTPGPEQLRSVQLALQGKDLSHRPAFYREYRVSREQVLERAQPIDVLLEKHPAQRQAILSSVAAMGRPNGSMKFLPLVARRQWVAFVDVETADIVGYAPFDGF